jgi:hypothetical protein
MTAYGPAYDENDLCINCAIDSDESSLQGEQ